MKLSDHIINRLEKKLVKLRLEHGSEYTHWPAQITTTVDRAPNYWVCVAFKRDVRQGWNGRVVGNWGQVLLNASAHGRDTRVYKAMYYSHARWVTARWRPSNVGSIYLDSAPVRVVSSFEPEATNPAAILLEMVAKELPEHLDGRGVPDVYVKRGAGFVLRKEILEAELAQINRYWARQSGNILERTQSLIREMKDPNNWKRRAYGIEYMQGEVDELNKEFAELRAKTNADLDEKMEELQNASDA